MTQGFWSQQIESSRPPGLGGIGDTTPPDSVAPDDITDLVLTVLSETSIKLDWTAPGDDAAVGTADEYFIVISTSVISAGTFPTDDSIEDAPYLATIPLPQIAGSAETVTVNNLDPNTLYYFAIITEDELNNASGISNLPSETTDPDTQAPPAVADLAASNPDITTIDLAFTAPTDLLGTITSYDIRKSLVAITGDDATWAAATSVVDALTPPTPHDGGESVTLTATGLSAETPYWFALKATDNATNESLLSNITTETTATSDAQAPDAVTDLAVTGQTTTTLTLGWTAPADQPENEACQSYDMRYSTSPITNNTEFLAASDVTSLGGGALPAPATPGTTQNYTTGTLDPDTTYYFAIKSTDEVPLTSAVNTNLPVSGKTSDTVAPATIADLAVTGINQDDMSFTFTAPHENAGGPGGTTVASYDIRISTVEITGDDATWIAATPITSAPYNHAGVTPLTPGTAQPFTVENLAIGTDYWLALKSSDEVPNVSALSNIITDITLDVDALDNLLPNGGELFEIRQAAAITWNVHGFVGTGTIDIYLSRDGGTTYETIALGVNATAQTYPWTPDLPLTRNAKIKLVANYLDVGSVPQAITLESATDFTIDLPNVLRRGVFESKV